MDELTTLKVERRCLPRFKTTLATRFRFLDLKNPGFLEAPTQDISSGGLFISRMFKEDEMGKQLEIELSLPDAPNPVRSLGKVTWIKRSMREDKILGLGIKFTEILPEEKRKLDSYIARFTPSLLSRIRVIRPPDCDYSDREKRNLEILDVLRRHTPISKTQIAQEVDLNIVTISNYIEDFKKKGVIFERGLDESSGGRRPSLLEINSEYAFILGVEINFLKGYIAAVMTDFTMRPVERRSIWMKDEGRNCHEELSSLITDTVAQARTDRSRIVGVGIGVSGSSNGYTGSLADYVRDRLGLPALIEDSSVASIFAEKLLNMDLAKKENVVYVSADRLSSDTDFSLILNGGLYRGTNRGRLRMWLSSARDDDPATIANCWVQSNCILRQEKGAVNSENAAAMGVRFGIRVAYLINILNPEAVVIGGVPAEARTAFFEALRQSVRRWTFNDATRTVRIISSQVEKDCVAHGMAVLVCRDAYSQV